MPATYHVVDLSPVALIPPAPGKEAEVVSRLSQAPHLEVYRKDQIPARWHFRDNPRITEVVAVADEGWVIGTRERVTRTPTLRRPAAPTATTTRWPRCRRSFSPRARVRRGERGASGEKRGRVRVDGARPWAARGAERRTLDSIGRCRGRSNGRESSRASARDLSDTSAELRVALRSAQDPSLTLGMTHPTFRPTSTHRTGSQ